MIIENDHIYNMDCLDGMRDIPSKSIDCVVTDCPYRICSGGVRLVPDGKECGGVLKKQQKVQPTSKLGEKLLHNDGSVTPFAMQGKMFANNEIKFSEWLPDVYRVLKDGTHCYIMVNSRNLKELQQAAEDVGFSFQNLLVWNKSNATPNKYYMQQLEFILMLSKRPARNINDMGQSNLLSCRNIIGKKQHPCLPAGEKVFINDKWMNIEEVKAGDNSGYGEVIATSSHIAEHIVELEVDKNICRATYNHPFLILRGNEVAWCEASQITTNDYILWRTYEKNELNQQKKDIPDYQEKNVTGNTNLSTHWYGKSILEQFQKGCRYITLTVTNKTMIFPISNLSIHLNTSGYTKVADLSKEYGINHVNAAVNINPLQQNIGILNLDTQVEEYVNHALYKNQWQFVRLSLRKVGSVKHIHEKTKVYNLTIAGTPSFDTLIGVSHNTEKPVSLMEVLINNSTNEGDVVLDPFAGGGSTLIAANRLNRRYIGFEIDKQYYDVAYNRLYKEPKEQTLF